MEYGKALVIVQGMVEQLRPYCERIEIAGSIRRGTKVEVKDGEIVAIGKSNLLAYVDEMVAHGPIQKAVYGDAQTYRWGPLYRGMQVGELKIELFLADADNWGYIHWLRTGPFEANVWMMKYLSWKKAPVRAKDGYWWWGDKKLRTSTEEDQFTLLGMPYLPPAERTEQRYKQLIQWNKEHKWPDFNPFVIQVIGPEQVLLPGMQARRWEFDEPEPVSENDREKRFRAEMEYWKILPVTPRMMANRAQVIAYTETLPTKLENLLGGDAFRRIRDELAVASYTERLPRLLERCDEMRVRIEALRVQIGVLHPQIQFLDYILTWPEINQQHLRNKRHELINQRRALEEAKTDLERELQPIDAEYHLVEADMPIRLERLNIAQQVEAEQHHALYGLNIAPGLDLYPEDFVGKHTAVLGMTGMGKSNLVSTFIEELAPHIQISVIDLEGEYKSLKKIHPFLVVGKGEGTDREVEVVDAGLLAAQIMDSGQSVILDMYEFNEEDRNEFLRLYLNRLFEIEGSKRKPHLIVLEEATEFLNQGKKSPVTKAATQIANRGRKRGIGLIMVSQRPASLDKNVLTQTRLLFLLGSQYARDIGAYRGMLPKTFDTENIAMHLKQGQAIVRRAGDGGLRVDVYNIRQRRSADDRSATPKLQKQLTPELA